MEKEIYEFSIHGDDRGKLVAVQELEDIPFAIKRIYYVFGTKEGVRRGYHSHKNLKQILICVHGGCKVLIDDGKTREVVVLDEPNKGLYINSNIWREMYDFTSDAVLLVLASELYDENDYIRDYQCFIESVKRKNSND